MNEILKEEAKSSRDSPTKYSSMIDSHRGDYKSMSLKTGNIIYQSKITTTLTIARHKRKRTAQ